MSVRRGGDADVDLLRAIRLEALADTPEAYGSTYAETAEWTDDQWLEVARRWTFFLAEDATGVVGMATGGDHDGHPGTSWLYGMYVTPRARGTGVAVELVDAVSTWARSRGADSLYLHVTDAVPRAQAFYRRVGFAPTGEVATLRRDAGVGLATLVKRLD
ncbi:MAG TPA: GNAT family N-acetyltransferase [Acidimicrobiales bacterium]|nr:GNAT family N-acetyltransferase [Acidimicrobiales bacterium]